MHDAGCLGLVHWVDPEGWYGEGGGRRVQDGEHMYKKKKKKNFGLTGLSCSTQALHFSVWALSSCCLWASFAAVGRLL